jgi:hypothetical protein
MRSFKLLGLLAVVFALSAIAAASASAATFTASATGSLTGKATNTQVWKFGGSVECTTAVPTGAITSTASTEQTLEIQYSNCKAFGFIGAHMNRAKYTLTADGTAHLLNTVTIQATGAGCDVTITPQTVSVVQFTNGPGWLLLLWQLGAILWHGTGGLCGTSGSSATFTGSMELQRVGGGSISWDK